MGKILIVDDSRTSRKMLREILEGMGHEIAGEATNGEEGYVMYKELNPDLVTLDITMPKMDGIEALMLIKKYNENAEAVMITAAGQKEKMIQAVKYGASEFITKPYESDEVERIIAQILDFSQETKGKIHKIFPFSKKGAESRWNYQNLVRFRCGSENYGN